MYQRIISVVPSQTELLAYLGAEEQVVGITKFCIHPAHWFREKARVGGTKQLHLDKIAALEPDLIIANKEENSQADIEALMQRYPVWVSEVYSWEDALVMIAEVGRLCGQTARAAHLVETLESKKSEWLQRFRTPVRPRAAYCIWREPYMVAARDTFIDTVLRIGGWENAFGGERRYPVVSVAQLQAAQPDYIFLSSEPYPFGAQHQEEIAALCPQARVRLVDGELFSWYGSRLLKTFDYLGQLWRDVGE